MKTSERTYKILLLLIGGGIIGMSAWGGVRLFTSHFSPFIEPTRAAVHFTPKTDAWNNALFGSLQAFMPGSITPGPLGKPFPFEDGGSALLSGQVSPLASMEEVPLDGARAVDIVGGSDDSVLVLLSGVHADGGVSYEIRSYAADGSAATFAAWQAGSGEVRAVRIGAVDIDGVWIGGTDGAVGRVSRGRSPEWFLSPETGLSGAIRSMAGDSAGRVWVTDGVGIAVGTRGVSPFLAYDVLSRIDGGGREAILSDISALPDAARPEPLAGADGLLRAALVPQRLSVIGAQIGVVTSRAAFVVDAQGGIRRIPVHSPASVPLVFDPEGVLFGRNAQTGELVRYGATGTTIYPSAASPQAARYASGLFAVTADALYALDYVPSATVLWTMRGGNWTAEIVAASGTTPTDTPVAVGADGSGGVWTVFQGGTLLHVKQGSAP